MMDSSVLPPLHLPVTQNKCTFKLCHVLEFHIRYCLNKGFRNFKQMFEIH